MRTMNFAKRNFKEIIRDPLSVVFAVLLPLLLLFIFQQFKIPSDNYRLENFTPGIVVFGFSFISMFTATLVSKDRTSSFLIRLGVSPMKPVEYILGYVLAIIPMIALQNVLFFILAVVLGLPFSVHIIWAILVSFAVSVLFIALGIIIGSVFSEKASSGIASIVVQLVCFTSGMYFPREMLGKGFSKVCEFLPFESCVTIIKGVMNNDLAGITPRNIIVFAAYTVVVFVIAVVLFQKKMLSDNKGS
ncbi:MAG: ABC transporter permease [Clostridia bacterium]|nr:ABC transporter permease [Clostridia bacterium]